MKFKWPVHFSVSMSFGTSSSWSESLAAQALRIATDHDPATVSSPSVAVEAAKVYLAYLETHK